MFQKYPLEWLDSLISLTLNPRKIYLHDLSKDDIQNLSEKASIEAIHIQSELKNQVFALHKESQIRLLVQKYHSALIILLDTIMEYQSDKVFQDSEYSNLAKSLISCLDELLYFIEKRFANFLSLDERVPATYLLVSRKELKLKLDRLQKKLVSHIADPTFTSIVLEHLQKFLQSKDNDNFTFRTLLYHRELVHKLELVGMHTNQSSVYSPLDEVLIYMNFNSRYYIKYFTRSIADKINILPTKAERIDSLHFHFKEFRQLQCHQNLLLNPERETLKDVFSKWFGEEIIYLEKTLQMSLHPVKSISGTAVRLKSKDKLTVNLSTDQIGLILRGCDELRLVEARSMSEVFRSIVPFLSTPSKQELSYDSVRTKSYSAEQRDKEIAVTILEKLILKIKTY
jgi:hypothetical protein